MHLERFKNQNLALKASQVPTRMEICTFIDLAEFIRQMAENIHTFGGSPIFSYGHPGQILIRYSKTLWGGVGECS